MRNILISLKLQTSGWDAWTNIHELPLLLFTLVLSRIWWSIENGGWNVRECALPRLERSDTPLATGESLCERRIWALQNSKPGEKLYLTWTDFGYLTVLRYKRIDEHKLKNAANTKKIDWIRKVKGSRSDNDVIFEFIQYAKDSIMQSPQ